MHVQPLYRCRCKQAVRKGFKLIRRHTHTHKVITINSQSIVNINEFIVGEQLLS